MKKIYKFIFSAFSIIGVINSEIQAIGGAEVEDVTSIECQRKGIVKIYGLNDGAISSGVLFYEGKGRFGLCAKHTAVSLSTIPTYVDLGGVRKKIKKFYTKKDADLAVFLLEESIDSIEDFPTLPINFEIPLIIEGELYGFGPTSSSTHPGSLENSVGICRKGKLFLSSLDEIDFELTNFFDENITNMNKEASLIYDQHKEGNSFISFSIPIKDTIIQNSTLQIQTLFHNGLNLKNNKMLTRSSSFGLTGDSGGPVLLDNKIIGIYSSSSPSITVPLKMLNTKPNKEYKQISSIITENQLNYNERQLIIYFHDQKGFYIWLDYTNITQDEYDIWRKNYSKLIFDECYCYYTKGTSSFLHYLFQNSTLKMEFLEKGFQSSRSYITQVQTNIPWIYRAMDAANKQSN